MIKKCFSIAWAVVAVAGVAFAQQTPGVLEYMKATVIPESNIVFGVGNAAPANDAGWAAVQKSATSLVAAAKKLEAMAPAGDNAAWLKFAREMGEASRKSADTAKARNVDAVLEAGDELYESCAGCHRIYLKR